VGVILGIIALVKIERSRGALGGRGLAIAGTVVSGVLVLLLPILAGLTLPALARAKGKAQAVMCMNQLKQLGLATMMYAGDNQERFPSGTNWCDAVQRYLGTGPTAVFQCPLAGHDQRCHYALNAQLSGVEQNRLSSPANTVLIFEIDGGWNASGGREQVTQRPRHGKAIGVVFADGHAEMVMEPRLESLRWQP